MLCEGAQTQGIRPLDLPSPHRLRRPGSDRGARVVGAGDVAVDAASLLAERTHQARVGGSPERVARVLAALGSPERSFRAIHLTGTNGKTTATLATAALLEAAGVRAGSFTSPHLERVEERIRLGGEEISPSELVSLLERVIRAADASGEEIGYFEALTLAALAGFAEAGVEVAAVEVGIGGLRDATNVLGAEVAVVTSVGLDHTEVLGDTLEEIATDKAAIAASAHTLVSGPVDPGLLPLLDSSGARRHLAAGRDWQLVTTPVASGQLLDLASPVGTHRKVHLGLRGPHQGANVATALLATEAALDRRLDDDEVARGLAALAVPGRLELLASAPLVLADGVKNPAGARALRAALDVEPLLVGRSLVVVVGLLAGHDAEEMLAALDVAAARLVVTCAPETPRALPAEVVAEAARAAGAPAVVVGEGVAGSVHLALRETGDADAVVVTGSLYVVGEARSALRCRGRADA